MRHKYLTMSSCGVILGVVLFGACGPNFSKETKPGQSIGNIRFDHSIPAFQHRRISKDLQVLEFIPIDSSQDAEMKRVMKLKDSSPQSMRNWLEDRVQYIISEDFPDSGLITESLPGTSLIDSTPLSPFSKDDSDIVMSNTGTGVFNYCEKKELSCSLKIPGHGVVPIRSPRAGIIQVGGGLFRAYSFIKDQNLDDITYSLLRLGTFYHEARHSDGNKNSLGIDPKMKLNDDPKLIRKGSRGFLHVKCPDGHDMEGEYACDMNLNGPYTVGPLVMKAMLDSCRLCSTKNKEIVKLFIADSFNRILHEKDIKEWDDTPEGTR